MPRAKKNAFQSGASPAIKKLKAELPSKAEFAAEVWRQKQTARKTSEARTMAQEARAAAKAAKAEASAARKAAKAAEVLARKEKKAEEKRLKAERKTAAKVAARLAKLEAKLALKLEKKTARKALRKAGGGPKRELSPALQLWRSILAAKGISGVLRKDDARYGSIKREFEIAKATL